MIIEFVGSLSDIPKEDWEKIPAEHLAYTVSYPDYHRYTTEKNKNYS